MQRNTAKCAQGQLCRMVALVLALLCAGVAGPSRAPLAAAGPSAVPGMWFTDQSARALAISGDTLYIGGDFTRIGQGVKGFAALTGDGRYDRMFPLVGRVQAMITDGAGGWFLGSNEARSDAPKPARLLHIRADHTIDPAWTPNLSGEVQEIAADSQRVYVYVDGTSAFRYRLLAYDRAAGGDPLWSVLVNDVTAIVASGGTLYVGGFFTEVGEPPVTRKYLAAFDGATGALKPWNPNANDRIWSMAASGGMVYIGGEFTDINGTPRNHIAALDAVSGIPSAAWNADADRPVLSLLAHGETVYAGGEFLNANGAPRAHLAALSAATGALTPWKPDPDQEVWAFAVDSGRLYVGGSFMASAVSDSAYLAAFDLATGAPLPFDARIDSSVATLAVNNGTILASGSFQGVNLVERQHIAAVDRATGLIKDWAPAVDGPVSELLAQGSTLYMAGDFTTVAGAQRPRAAAIDITTGALTGWNPQPNGTIAALLADGDLIYAGGAFTAVNSPAVPRRYLAAFDAATGAATDWNPNPDDSVFALALSGTALFVGGRFLNVGVPALNRKGLASFDRATGALTDWNPAAGIAPNTPLVVSGTTLYAGTLAIDTTTGALVPWKSTYQGVDVEIAAEAGDVLYGFTKVVHRMFVFYRFVGVDRATGIVATCGSISDQGLREVLPRDGIVYGIYAPTILSPPTNFIPAVALQPQFCLTRTYLPMIVH